MDSQPARQLVVSWACCTRGRGPTLWGSHSLYAEPQAAGMMGHMR